MINKKREFVGTLTDGDIRSGILRGVSLEVPVKKLTNKKPITVKSKESKILINKLMIENSILQIPIVEKKSFRTALKKKKV